MISFITSLNQVRVKYSSETGMSKSTNSQLTQKDNLHCLCLRCESSGEDGGNSRWTAADKCRQSRGIQPRQCSKVPKQSLSAEGSRCSLIAGLQAWKQPSENDLVKERLMRTSAPKMYGSEVTYRTSCYLVGYSSQTVKSGEVTTRWGSRAFCMMRRWFISVRW